MSNRLSLILTLLLSQGCHLTYATFDYGSDDAATADAGTDGGLADGGHDASTPDSGLDAGLIDAGQEDAGPRPLVAPDPRTPWNGAMTGSSHTATLDPPQNALRPRFTWTEVPDATEYEIQVSSGCSASAWTTCTFTSGGTITERTNETQWRPATALPISTVRPVGRRYYWRVRGCRPTEDCSDWSRPRYVDVGRIPTDLTGDGYADLLIGDVEGLGGGGRFYFGPDLTLAPQRISPTDAGSRVFVALAGDVDADGYPDALVYGAGVVWVFPGGPGGPDATRAVGLPGTELGIPAGLGDVNGDGYADVVAGLPFEDGGAAIGVGTALFFRGGSLGIDPGSVLALTSPSPRPMGGFGVQTAMSGDLNSDGFHDIVVGAQGESGGAVSQAGAVHVFFGAAGGPAAVPEITLVSPSPSGGGGFAFPNSGGDLNCDGLGDLVVGADGEERAYVFSGSALSGSPVLTIQGEGVGPKGVGSTASFASDADADGSDDLIVTLDSDPGVSDRGVAWALGACGSPPSSTLESFPGPSGITAFGAGAVWVGDRDGDGLPEAAVPTEDDGVLMLEWDPSTPGFTQVATAPDAPYTFNIAGLR